VEAERRQVTVLFADMVDFTTFSERSGEEAAFNLMQSLAKLMEEAVRDHGGVVQGFTGDGIMAVFGAPVAFEDAPLRACRAALAILAKLKDHCGDLEAKHGTQPRLHIGVNSGPAVTGKVRVGADAAVTVLGDTVNVAARLQALAEPGTALMSEATNRLVQGLVEASFIGEHRIKGKSELQKAYRLDAIRPGAARFDAKIHRGLTTYVGRNKELETLEGARHAISSGIQVIDIVGEPGIGKSRLLHEFLGQVEKHPARVLIGHCTSDGQQTPFQAFIEIARGAFGLATTHNEADVAAKLNRGLDELDLGSAENLGLLLNLLGHKAPNGALDGLDGALIGLRTRDLVKTLVLAGSWLTPMIMVLEDLHWSDSASEELLAKIVSIDEPVQLLILHTRRPEYHPPWEREPHVALLPLSPLSVGETTLIAKERLGVDKLDEPLAKLISEKAEGNALFAEEIANFLIERGIVRRSAAALDFDTAAAAAALPESVQSLLASRIDRLAPPDRVLLQTAAVVGRRFDPDLVAGVSDLNGSAGSSFAAMEGLDLIYPADGSGDYIFKHALVRDALYNGLLTSSRAALHLKVAEELERRGVNRLTEIAEVLAHHYAATSRVDKAFTYLAMAGHKSLDVHSILEAEKHYRLALEIFEKHPKCADRSSVARVVVRLLEALTNKGEGFEVRRVARKFMPFVRETGETTELVIGSYFEAISHVDALEFHAAHEMASGALAIAERIGDIRGRAYARAMLLLSRIILGLDPLEAADRMKEDLARDCARSGENFILNWAYVFIVFDYFYRGLNKEARTAALRLIASGQERKDPRSISQANLMLAYIDMFGDDPIAAIARAHECMRIAVAPNEKLQGAVVKATAEILLGRAREGLAELEAANAEFERLGSLFFVQTGPRGVALAMMGHISEGIHVIERQIAQSDSVGDQVRAAWSRIMLAEVYIQILSGKERPTLGVLLRNLWTIVDVMIFGVSRARDLLKKAAQVKMLSEGGVHIARINYDLGVLATMKNRRDEARRFFAQARAGAESQSAVKLLQRVDAALAQLG
jgi:class 3 adenylate cyclase